ncbi:MAG: diacylglycerol kinase family lipid kinase [Elusimicrobiota bacterium]
MNRYLFIINPKSGVKFNKSIEKKIKEKFSKKDALFSIEYTRYKNHSKEIVLRYVNNGYPNIIVAGGDGTIKEVAEIIVGKENINLGILPAGSGNGLARNLFLPLDISKAVDVIFKNKIRKIDCGLANGNIFISTCGMGFDAEVAYLFNHKTNLRGLLPYFIHGVFSYFRFKPKKTKVFIDGKRYVFQPIIATVANGMQYGGGAIISPNSIIDDGFLEFVVIENPGFFKTLLKINSLFNSKILENEFVKSFRAKNFKIIIPKGTVYHLDGEDYLSEGEIEISILHKCLNVFAI